MLSMFNVVKDNPFTKEFYEQELQRVKFPPTSNGRVSIVHHKLEGRLDGYMYKDWAVDYPVVPIFKIDGKVWMSVTPMEVESHYMPIQLANGRVGVGGLGLGYYTQRILDLDRVEEVVVYELDKDVIDTYLENFGPHEKLTIHNTSVLDIENEEFDFFYNDIYETLGDFDAIEHMQLLKNNNAIDVYHFWTMEMFILALVNGGLGEDIPTYWKWTYLPFLQKLIDTKGNMVQSILDGEEVYEKLCEFEFME